MCTDIMLRTTDCRQRICMLPALPHDMRQCIRMYSGIALYRNPLADILMQHFCIARGLLCIQCLESTGGVFKVFFRQQSCRLPASMNSFLILDEHA